MNERNQNPQLNIEALRAGDRKEFARMVDMYSGHIYRLAIKMLQNPQDAEDVLQETFIKAYHHLPTFQGKSNVSTWLYRIATNEALMLLRKRKVTTFSVDAPAMDGQENDGHQEIIDWCCLPEDELMSAEAQEVLDKSIDLLPETLRVVFLLRDIEGLSTQETADVLGISTGAVKTRLSRARLQLRELLTAYFGDRVRQLGSQKQEVPPGEAK